MKPARILVLFVLSLLPGVFGARADENEAYRRMMAEQRKNMDAMLKQRPEFKPGETIRMDEILRLAVVDGKLAITSPLMEGPNAIKGNNRGQMRAKIEGMEGWAMIMAQSIGRGAAGNSWFFNFNHITYPDDEGQQNLIINAQPGVISLSKNFNSPKRSFSISLQQLRTRPGVNIAEGVSLNIYEGDNGGRPPVSINIAEKDFGELRRKHPKEVDQFLRPLLKELRLEGLFTIEHAVAWQVFANEWKRNDAMEKEVKSLVAKLDSEIYSEREAAMTTLRAMGPDGALVLYHLDRDGLSLEQLGRVDALIAVHSFLARDQAARVGSDPEFLLDCLYSDEVPIREVAAKRLDKLAGKELGIDPAASREIRGAKIEAVRGELSPRSKPATTKPTTAPVQKKAVTK